MRRALGLALALVAGAPGLLVAQYFGQNKVHYRAFDFQVIHTGHFDVYFYPEERPAALDAARMAERAYARLARVLHHEFAERKPIVLYASHADFQQTNTSPDTPGEGTGGFTDFLKHRNVVPFTGSYREFEHVLTHEMVHQFQYDTWSRGHAGAGIQLLVRLNPPLWLVEGMAEYLSLGGVDPNTAMWLRDAALEGTLPTIAQLSDDPRIFPYRYGQAVVAYIGERWGDEALGAIMRASLAGNLQSAFVRVLGVDFAELSRDWREAVQKRYLPEAAGRAAADAVGRPLLTRDRSGGTLHLAPALAPDGSRVAYFSERNFYFVDLYLAGADSGRVRRRLLKSSFSSDYESFRFVNSGVSWSPDGRSVALVARQGRGDAIVIVDADHPRAVARIPIPLNGAGSPSWSPDGRRLVFTGYDGGLSDLFIVNVDGTGLQRLTRDKFADLHPAWSPDGQTLAFATDRGPATSFEDLRFGGMRIALYHLDTGDIELLPGTDQGTNSSPQWAPDGRSIAFISDRTGVGNIFLYDAASRSVRQITDLATGAQGITPLSPALSWARQADRLAFVCFEHGDYDVYTLDHPQQAAPVAPPEGREIARVDTLPPAAGPRSLTALLDSADLTLPDTALFEITRYRPHYTPDYVAQPTVGYTRDTFGRGFFGGAAVSLSDVLGDRTLIFSGYINGRLAESQILAAYINQAHRINYAAGVSQEPYFYREVSEIRRDDPSPGENTLVTNIRRLVVRSAFTQGYLPFSSFQRLELGLQVANVEDARLSVLEPYSATTGFATGTPALAEQHLGSIYYVQPSLALVFDNSLMGPVAPFFGRRWRIEVSPTLGTWRFAQALVDYRRYDPLPGPFTLATRALYFGRTGRDADQFQLFLGGTDLLRGQTSGSYLRHECRNANDLGTQTGCTALDRLIGTQMALASAELRFPLLSPAWHWLPLGFPPVEGALFYEAGVAWAPHSTVQLGGSGGGTGDVRRPLASWGASVRVNAFGYVVLRVDYARPLNRPGFRGGLVTLSLGPAF